MLKGEGAMKGYKSGDLIPVDKQVEDAIRAGMVTEGFSEHDASCVGIRERCGVTNSRVFRLTLEFNEETALDYLESITHVDNFIYLGRKFAKDLQVMLSRLLPNIRIGDKVIMSVKEYEELRGQAMEARVRF